MTHWIAHSHALPVIVGALTGLACTTVAPVVVALLGG